MDRKERLSGLEDDLTRTWEGISKLVTHPDPSPALLPDLLAAHKAKLHTLKEMEFTDPLYRRAEVQAAITATESEIYGYIDAMQAEQRHHDALWEAKRKADEGW